MSRERKNVVGNQERVNNRMMMNHIRLILKKMPLKLFTIPSCDVDKNRELLNNHGSVPEDNA